MKGICFRSMWAWGYSSWEWVLVPATFKPADVRSLMDEKAEEHSYSDKFRRMEWKVTKKVPLDVIDEKIKHAHDALKSARAHLADLRAYRASVQSPAKP